MEAFSNICLTNSNQSPPTQPTTVAQEELHSMLISLIVPTWKAGLAVKNSKNQVSASHTPAKSPKHASLVLG
jgi:hypothetical protein